MWERVVDASSTFDLTVRIPAFDFRQCRCKTNKFCNIAILQTTPFSIAEAGKHFGLAF
jgi:hypothetical protein